MTGGTVGTDYYEYWGNLVIMTDTPLHLTTHGNAVAFRIVTQSADQDMNLTLEDFHLNGTIDAAITTPKGTSKITIIGNVTLTSDFSPFACQGNLYITGTGDAQLTIHKPSGTHTLITNPVNTVSLTLKNLNLTLSHANFIYLRNVQLVGTSDIRINGTHIFDNTIPKPQLTTSTLSINQIEVAPTNYLRGIFGKTLYSLNGTDWEDNGGTFTNLTPGTPYTIHAKYEAANGLQESPVASISVTTPVEYTVNIPATTQADGTSVDITVDDDLALGASGQVDVKIIDGGTIQDNGRLQLFHSVSGDMIRSQLLVNNEIFNVRIDGVRQSVATFTMTNQDPVPISFATPNEATIPAGTYEGTVVFAISYSD